MLESFGLTGADEVHAHRAVWSGIHGFLTLEHAGVLRRPASVRESYRRMIAIYADALGARELRPTGRSDRTPDRVEGVGGRFVLGHGGASPPQLGDARGVELGDDGGIRTVPEGGVQFPLHEARKQRVDGSVQHDSDLGRFIGEHVRRRLETRAHRDDEREPMAERSGALRERMHRDRRAPRSP